VAGGVLLASLLAPCRGLAAEAPAVAAVPSKSEVTVGEVFAVDVKASGPSGTRWTFPELAGNDSVEIRRAAPAEGAGTASGAPPLPPGTSRYEAVVYALGDVELPAIPVKYRLPDGGEGEASTTAVPLRVVSMLPKDEAEPKLADIHAPLALPIGAAFWIGLAALVLLMASLALWWRRRRRRARASTAPAAQELAPDVEARQALERLAASGARERGEYRGFYIALTEIAKRYLERRLAAPVLEMTSAEMLAFLRDHAHGRGFAPALRDLAGAADQVKFAAVDGRAEEALRHLGAVRETVDALEALLRPSASEAPAEKVA
jgi:hypothetical protein